MRTQGKRGPKSARERVGPLEQNLTRDRSTFQSDDFSKRGVATANNVLALKHGAKSPRTVQANLPSAVAEVRNDLAAALPYLEAPDGLIVEQLARLLVRIRLLDSYYDRLGGSLVDNVGRPRKSWNLYMALAREFRATARDLGIGPAARADLLGGMAMARQAAHAVQAGDELRERYAKA